MGREKEKLTSLGIFFIYFQCFDHVNALSKSQNKFI